jgi:hypothetical protein
MPDHIFSAGMFNFEQRDRRSAMYHRVVESLDWSYERLCDEELAAAELAATKDARIAHLEQAFRFAQRAVTSRTSERAIEAAS